MKVAFLSSLKEGASCLFLGEMFQKLSFIFFSQSFSTALSSLSIAS